MMGKEFVSRLTSLHANTFYIDANADLAIAIFCLITVSLLPSSFAI